MTTDTRWAFEVGRKGEIRYEYIGRSSEVSLGVTGNVQAAMGFTRLLRCKEMS